MKINIGEFENYIKNNTWVNYASETIHSENPVRLRLLYNADGFYRVTKGNDELYFGLSMSDAVKVYNKHSE